jgi:hypothetical protein
MLTNTIGLMQRISSRLFPVLVVLASFGGAIVYLGSTPPWSAPEGLPRNPLVFDAPTRSVVVTLAEKQPGRFATTSIFNSVGEVIVLDDWNYAAIVRGAPPPSKSN